VSIIINEAQPTNLTSVNIILLSYWLDDSSQPGTFATRLSWCRFSLSINRLRNCRLILELILAVVSVHHYLSGDKLAEPPGDKIDVVGRRCRFCLINFD
jgi:hypothetical protein